MPEEEATTAAKRESTVAVLCCMLIGTGVMLPWNAFLTAYDFFVHIYAGFPFEFALGCFYNAAGSLVLFACIFLGKYLGSLGTRLAVCFTLDCLMLAIVPVLAIFLDASLSVWLVLSATAVTGAVTAVSFGASISLASLFGPKSIAACMAGNGVSGLVVSVIRIVTKVTVPATRAGDITSAVAYFATAAVIVLVCVFASLFLVRTPEAAALIAAANAGSKSAEAKKRTDEETASLLGVNATSMKDGVSIEAAMDDKPKVTVKSVLKKMWLQALTVWSVFFVTLSLFPGVTTMIKPQLPESHTTASSTSDSDSLSSGSAPQSWLAEWFSLILITLFMVFDFIGRYLPSFVVVCTPRTLWIPVVARVVFFPLFSLMAKGIWTAGVNVWAPIIMIVFAFTNGYFSTVAMIFGPAPTAPEERETASTIMSFGLNFGIFCASFFALLMLYFINGSFSV